MNDGAQIKIYGDVVDVVLDDDDEDRPAMETTGVESMSLSE
jgi:hypothetical protein